MSDHTTFRIPGQLITDLLKKNGWNQRVLAIVLGLKDPVVSKLISGEKPVDAEMALSLGDIFGIDADQFLTLQRSYDLEKARLISRPNPEREMRAHLFGKLPIADMIKRGWIQAENPRDVAEVEKELTKFFRAESSSEIEILPHAAKKTSVNESVTPTQLAWIYRVKEIASEMLVSKYSPKAVEEAIIRLAALRAFPDEIRKVPRILSDCGIRFLIVETLPSAKIDGVCFWLDDKSPVIALTTRYDRIDNFWFVLRHELEHVLRLDGRLEIMMDADLEGENAGTGSDIAEAERAANLAAAEFCVPSALMDQFVARKSPFFAERDVIGFARTLKIHPGLVAGQIQRRIKRYDRFRDHLIKIREIIAPSSIVDGWGDIAPIGE